MESDFQAAAEAALHAFWRLSQSPARHDRDCPAGREGSMLRWERVDLSRCTCPEFMTLIPLRPYLDERAEADSNG